ncbi:hypothetical protein ABNF97_33700, partial [Plantactinospora sp. B6F1]|uniref:hypothetical protein n=1 Tax=Plantactinospora sp. B6F1 TaxID=3158971 RepID=UPI0032D940CF
SERGEEAELIRPSSPRPMPMSAMLKVTIVDDPVSPYFRKSGSPVSHKILTERAPRPTTDHLNNQDQPLT